MSAEADRGVKMNNINYLPFVRNRYYYGKLLSVEDFELEQRYHNNKRRLINRFLGGSGVISGLNVVIIDDETISLERGIAVDSIGREIIVEEPVTKRLADINGYDMLLSESIPYAYLCIEYAEEEKEAVHNIAGRNQDRMQEFNKFHETSRLYLTSHEPGDINSISNEGIYTEKSLVYDEDGIRIYHIIPRFVKQNKEFEFIVEIENMGQAEDFAFSYNIGLMFLKNQSGAGEAGADTAAMPVLKVDFDERLIDKELRYKLVYKLSAVNAENEASAEIDSGSFRLLIGGRTKPSAIRGISKTTIVSGSIISSIMDSYYQSSMNQAMERRNGHAVYLAKLFLVKAGSRSVVKQAEAMPFHQYIYNNDLSYAVIKQLIAEIEQLKHKIEVIENAASKGDQTMIQDNITAFGIYELAITGNTKKKRIYLSEEIIHGLGIGQAGILLGYENDNGEIIYGGDSMKDVSLTAKLYPDKGSFVLAVRFREAYNKESMLSKYSLKIHWTAVKNPEISLNRPGSTGKRLSVYPGIIEMKVRESRFIDAACVNMKDKRLSFYVNDNEGIVDKNGLYTAPDREGIYEVRIESMAYAGIKTSVYMIVREEA